MLDKVFIILEENLKNPYSTEEKDIKIGNDTYNKYEEQTAVSEEVDTNQYDTSLQGDYKQIESLPQHQLIEEVKKNDELLSLLIGGKEETRAQKREKQKQYREALEQQKRLNAFYTRNLNPE